MPTRLLTLLVRRRRDWLLVRHRTRQIASLLGYSPDDQALVAAAAFELSRRACESAGRLYLHFDLATDKLMVVPEAANEPECMMRLERPLPARRPDLGTQDLAFVVKQLTERTPLDVMTEIERSNLELLRLAAEVQKAKPVAPARPEDNSEISAA